MNVNTSGGYIVINLLFWFSQLRTSFTGVEVCWVQHWNASCFGGKYGHQYALWSGKFGVWCHVVGKCAPARGHLCYASIVRTWSMMSGGWRHCLRCPLYVTTDQISRGSPILCLSQMKQEKQLLVSLDCNAMPLLCPPRLAIQSELCKDFFQQCFAFTVGGFVTRRDAPGDSESWFIVLSGVEGPNLEGSLTQVGKPRLWALSALFVTRRDAPGDNEKLLFHTFWGGVPALGCEVVVTVGNISYNGLNAWGPSDSNRSLHRGLYAGGACPPWSENPAPPHRLRGSQGTEARSALTVHYGALR